MKVDQYSAGQIISAGTLIYPQDLATPGGRAWRIVSGSVRLDRVNGDEILLAGIALPGDLIGAETLLLERTTFAARAMSPVELAVWPEGSESLVPGKLLATLASAEQRAASVLALRCGQAAARVRRLIGMLASRHPVGKQPSETAVSIDLPGLRDIADATDLTIETVSRVISRMRDDGMLKRQGRGRIAIAHESGFL